MDAQDAEQFDFHIESLPFHTSLQSMKFSQLQTHDIAIATITTTMRPTNKSVIDMVQVANSVSQLGNDFNIRVKQDKLKGKDKAKTNKKFLNCIIFENNDSSNNIVTKLFSNGSMHITGSKNVVDAFQNGYKLYQFLKLQAADTLTISVQMINATYSIGIGINVAELFQYILTMHTSNTQIIPKLNKHNHPALIIAYHDTKEVSKKITVLIFTTGKIIITGAQKAHDIHNTFDVITNIIDKAIAEKPHIRNDAFLKLPKVAGEQKKRGRKRKADTAAFYDNLIL